MITPIPIVTVRCFHTLLISGVVATGDIWKKEGLFIGFSYHSDSGYCCNSTLFVPNSFCFAFQPRITAAFVLVS